MRQSRYVVRGEEGELVKPLWDNIPAEYCSHLKIQWELADRRQRLRILRMMDGGAFTSILQMSKAFEEQRRWPYEEDQQINKHWKFDGFSGDDGFPMLKWENPTRDVSMVRAIMEGYRSEDCKPEDIGMDKEYASQCSRSVFSPYWKIDAQWGSLRYETYLEEGQRPMQAAFKVYAEAANADEIDEVAERLVNRLQKAISALRKAGFDMKGIKSNYDGEG